MDINALLSNKAIGGSHADYRISPEWLTHPRTRRVWRAIMILLIAEVVVGLAALVFAFVNMGNHDLVTPAVWFRGVVVLLMTLTLFVFARIAMMGYYWAYSRLRLFTQIFPIVTLIVATIPNLYPYWMVIEQIVFSLLMIGISDYLRNDHMREVFRKPGKASTTPLGDEKTPGQ